MLNWTCLLNATELSSWFANWEVNSFLCVFVVAVLEATPVWKKEISCSTMLQKGCMITEIEFMCVPADPPMLCLSKSLSPQNPLHLARYTTTHWGRRIFLSPWKAVASCRCKAGLGKLFQEYFWSYLMTINQIFWEIKEKQIQLLWPPQASNTVSPSNHFIRRSLLGFWWSPILTTVKHSTNVPILHSITTSWLQITFALGKLPTSAVSFSYTRWLHYWSAKGQPLSLLFSS